eukprot:1156649-Pelagomonas_calceolata.AAC.3
MHISNALYQHAPPQGLHILWSKDAADTILSQSPPLAIPGVNKGCTRRAFLLSISYCVVEGTHNPSEPMRLLFLNQYGECFLCLPVPAPLLQCYLPSFVADMLCSCCQPVVLLLPALYFCCQRYALVAGNVLFLPTPVSVCVLSSPKLPRHHLVHQVLEQLVASIAAHLPLILRVADNVAMLDMLLAFSEV